MAPVVSQYVGIKFIPGTGHVAINTRSLDKLGDRLKADVMESGYQAQRACMYSNEAGLALVSGEVPNPGPETIFGKTGTRMNFFSDEALKECADIADASRPEYNRWHEKLNKMCGFSLYDEFKPVAREYDKDALAINVEPRRWWKSA